MARTASRTALAGAGITAAVLALAITTGGAFADDNGRGHGNGNSNGNGRNVVQQLDVATATATAAATAAATAVSAQPSPTPAATATAVSAQPTPTAGGTPAPTGTPSAGSLEERHGISGEVTATGSGTLTIRTESGLVATIKLTANTEIRGEGHDALAPGDIAVGDRVNVQGTPTAAAGDATLVAEKIEVHKAEHGARDKDDDKGDDKGDDHDNRGAGPENRGRGRD